MLLLCHLCSSAREAAGWHGGTEGAEGEHHLHHQRGALLRPGGGNTSLLLVAPWLLTTPSDSSQLLLVSFAPIDASLTPPRSPVSPPDSLPWAPLTVLWPPHPFDSPLTLTDSSLRKETKASSTECDLMSVGVQVNPVLWCHWPTHGLCFCHQILVLRHAMEAATTEREREIAALQADLGGVRSELEHWRSTASKYEEEISRLQEAFTQQQKQHNSANQLQGELCMCVFASFLFHCRNLKIVLIVDLLFSNYRIDKWSFSLPSLPLSGVCYVAAAVCVFAAGLWRPESWTDISDGQTAPSGDRAEQVHTQHKPTAARSEFCQVISLCLWSTCQSKPTISHMSVSLTYSHIPAQWYLRLKSTN